MDLFNTFCRLCMNSSDCVAKENECKDSVGKRVRSSPKARAGEAGAEGVEPEGCLEVGGVICSDAARCEVGNLGPGCWRMRRRPEEPMPCSCSGRMGDLTDVSARSLNRLSHVLYASCVSPPHLAILSSCPASMLMRFILRDKGGGAICESRLLVLLFLGRETLSEANRRVCCGLESSLREPGGVRGSVTKLMCATCRQVGVSTATKGQQWV
jgi:hypothetical protein